MILLASIKAEMKSRWPEEPPEEPMAAEKRALRRSNKKRDAYVTLSRKQERCKAQAMK